jgi:hypothetical protein
MQEDTSTSLILRMRTAVDDDVWQRFYLIYAPLIEEWLRRRGVPHSAAEDVRQEVLLKVYQEIRAFEHNGRPDPVYGRRKAVRRPSLGTGPCAILYRPASE